MQKMDYGKAIEIAPQVYWVGYNFKDLWFHTNPYLIVDGDEAVLFDPGSMVDFRKVHAKVRSVCPLSKIKYIVLHHQDPDLCGSTAEFQKRVKRSGYLRNEPGSAMHKEKSIAVYMPERATVFAKFYGFDGFVAPVSSDKEYIELESGRRLRFYLTPYCHSPGAMVTYDEKSKILFSSDIFGAFNNEWKLYADMYEYEEHLGSVRRFMEPYMASKSAVMNFVKKVEKLDIKMICPQHGSIIRRDVKKWIGELKKMKYGTAIDEKNSGLEFRMFDF